jgi:hypothetical protein
MSHLDAETLAALADTEAAGRDADHLRECAACARELEAYRAVRTAGARSSAAVLDAPLPSWATLAPALREARLIDQSASGAPAGGRPFIVAPWMRVAAAIVLVAGGAIAGRVSAPAAAGGPAATGPADGTTVDAIPVVNPGPRLLDGTQILSLPQAMQIVERAEADYRIASAYIAQYDTAYGHGDIERYRTRLAALDRLSDVALEAVNRTPQDPVVNQIYSSTRAARSATLQQLGSRLPAGARLASY